MAKAKTEETEEKKKKPKKKETDSKQIKKAYKNQPLSKLKFNMVSTGYLQAVYIEDNETIILDHSWIELCLILLGTIHKCNKADYLKVLLKNNVLSTNFEVTSIKGEFIDNNSRIRTYEIAGSDFYLITDMNEKSIFKGIAGMASALSIKPDKMLLDIIPLDRVITAVKLTEGTVAMRNTELSLAEAFISFNDSSRITSINILGYEKQLGTFTDAVLELINWLNEMYGEAKLVKSMKCNLRAVGIVENEKVDCIDIVKIGGTKLFLYDNNSNAGCIEYMIGLCSEFGLSSEFVKLGISQMQFSNKVG